MDITPQDNTLQSISDDQELAKALAGVLPDDEESKNDTTQGFQFEETPATAAIPPIPQAEAPAAEAPAAAPVLPTPTPAATAPVSGSSDLDSIKLSALKDLRPLMDKVDLPAEEKFDTYLMLIRSTDDSSLIGPAHAAAQGIADEKKKAEALLEVIKEIDYLSRKDQPTV
ncbi:MAG: hypothetical protein ACREGE_04260 [Candidatus Microsaccharimonas sp.]